MTNLRNMLQNSADDLDTAIERECWEDVSIIVAYMRIALEAQPLAGTPHPFQYLCAICGLPPSAHSPVEPTAKPRVCADSADGDHVLKQDGPFSVVYCDACGMNKGHRDPPTGLKAVEIDNACTHAWVEIAGKELCQYCGTENPGAPPHE